MYKTQALRALYRALATGIKARNAGFILKGWCNTALPCTNLTRSYFNGLYTGIIITKVDTDIPFTIYQCDFENCFIGIKNEGVTGGTIVGNYFEMGQLPTTTYTNKQLGIELINTINGMQIQENDFEYVSSIQAIETAGIGAFNLSTFNNIIRKNYFDGLTIGNQAGGFSGGNESGLIYQCNENTDNTDFDFFVCDGEFTNDRIRKIQDAKDQFQATIAAGNVFSNSGISAPDYADFLNEGAIELIYHHKENGGASEVPDDYFGFESLVSQPENTCDTEFCLPPCRSRTQLNANKQVFYGYQNDYHIALDSAKIADLAGDTTLFAQKQTEAASFKLLMDQLSYEIYVHELIDTVDYHIDTVRAWLSNMESYTAETDLALQLLVAGDSLAADSILNQISTKFDISTDESNDLVAVEDLFDMIYGYDLKALPKPKITDLLALADSSFFYASGKARNILGYYGHTFTPEYCIHPNEELRPIVYPNGADNIAPVAFFQVYPNPAGNEVTFLLRQADKSAVSITVSDLHGRQIWAGKVPPFINQLQWQIPENLNGVYFYQFEKEGQLLDTGRLIIQ